MKALGRTSAGSRIEFSRRQSREPIEVVISKEALHANTAAPSASSRPESHSPMNARLSLDVPSGQATDPLYFLPLTLSNECCVYAQDEQNRAKASISSQHPR